MGESCLSGELPPCPTLGGHNEKTPWGLGQVPGLAGRVDQSLTCASQRLWQKAGWSVLGSSDCPHRQRGCEDIRECPVDRKGALGREPARSEETLRVTISYRCSGGSEWDVFITPGPPNPQKQFKRVSFKYKPSWEPPCPSGHFPLPQPWRVQGPRDGWAEGGEEPRK